VTDIKPCKHCKKLVAFIESLTMRGIYSDDELKEAVKDQDGEWQSDDELETALLARKLLSKRTDNTNQG